MRITGKFYNGRTASAQDAILHLYDSGIVQLEPKFVTALSIHEVKISRRVGGIPRHLTFPSNAMFETEDHDSLDNWLSQQGVMGGWAHRLENSSRFIIGALLSVIAISVWAAIWGIPWASEKIAYALPAHISSALGEGTLEILDERILDPSLLPIERQNQLKQLFSSLTPGEEGVNYRLIFRDGGFIGANAFALPDGTILMTDQLVQLAHSDDEIASIMLHEIGHVAHRHSLQMVISHSTLSMLTLLITGDLSSAGAIVVALPNVLVGSSYNRTLESDADDYALSQMLQLDIPTDHFANFMERLTACSHALEDQSEDEFEKDCELLIGNREQNESSKTWLDYVSSHPPTEERIGKFRTP